MGVTWSCSGASTELRNYVESKGRSLARQVTTLSVQFADLLGALTLASITSRLRTRSNWGKEKFWWIWRDFQTHQTRVTCRSVCRPDMYPAIAMLKLMISFLRPLTSLTRRSDLRSTDCRSLPPAAVRQHPSV